MCTKYAARTYIFKNERAYISQSGALWTKSCGASFLTVAKGARHTPQHDVSGSFWTVVDEGFPGIGARYSTVTNAPTLSSKCSN